MIKQYIDRTFGSNEFDASTVVIYVLAFATSLVVVGQMTSPWVSILLTAVVALYVGVDFWNENRRVGYIAKCQTAKRFGAERDNDWLRYGVSQERCLPILTALSTPSER